MTIPWRTYKTVDRQGAWNTAENLFIVNSPHALSQVAGYAKYKLYEGGNVYFRGQVEQYSEMRPSLYRGVRTFRGCNTRVRYLHAYINEIGQNSSFLSNTPEHVCEPLLQHYGLKTRWLDVVDNIWSALWFACHAGVTAGTHGEFINFEVSTGKYCFIYFLQFGKMQEMSHPGMYLTELGFHVVDLRVAAPSLYLRPHSQHGLLAMRTSTASDADVDYQGRVVGVVGIPIDKAVSWLGEGLLSKTHFMFPSPKYDHGYALFLKKKLEPPNALGRISLIGA